jgi:hypothetical protein
MNTPEFMTHERIMTGKEYVAYSDYLSLQRERDEAISESEEQARLLGMSAEREESIRGKLFLAERELAKLKAAAKEVVKVWETPPWKIGETPSNAITQLRDAIGYED